MKKFFCPIVLCLLFSFSVSADQWEWLFKEQVVAAVKLTANQKTLMKYCKPCGGTPIEIIVNNIRAERMNDGLYNFMLNHVPQDLAYLYYFKEGEWHNIAITLGLKTIGSDYILVKPELDL